MTKKVYVEAEMIEEKSDSQMCHIIFDFWGKGGNGVERCVDTDKVHEIPKLVELPKFVVDWLETAKKEPLSLLEAFDLEDQRLKGKIRRWLSFSKNQELFSRAWLDGYLVKKDPRWIVTDGHENPAYLYSFNLEEEHDDIYSFAEKKSEGIPFENKCEAELIAKFVGGTVEVAEREIE